MGGLHRVKHKSMRREGDKKLYGRRVYKSESQPSPAPPELLDFAPAPDPNNWSCLFCAAIAARLCPLAALLAPPEVEDDEPSMSKMSEKSAAPAGFFAVAVDAAEGAAAGVEGLGAIGARAENDEEDDMAGCMGGRAWRGCENGIEPDVAEVRAGEGEAAGAPCGAGREGA